jgi:hypothetical protein
MSTNVVVWDIETVPDLKGFAAANGLGGKCDERVRAAMGEPLGGEKSVARSNAVSSE